MSGCYVSVMLSFDFKDVIYLLMISNVMLIDYALLRNIYDKNEAHGPQTTNSMSAIDH